MGDAAVWLWDALREQFETDDGSLPDIYIEYANCSAIAEAYLLLRGRASEVVTEDPSFWSVHKNKPCGIDSVPNAAALVVSYEAEPFCVTFRGIRASGKEIPDLGVFVFQESINLFYRMGIEWGPEQIESLFHLLVELTSFDREARVELDAGWPAELRQPFEDCWRKFKAGN